MGPSNFSDRLNFFPPSLCICRRASVGGQRAPYCSFPSLSSSSHRKCIRQCKKQSKFNDACPSFLPLLPSKFQLCLFFPSSESQSAKRERERKVSLLFPYFEDIRKRRKKSFFFSAAAAADDLSNFYPLSFLAISIYFSPSYNMGKKPLQAHCKKRESMTTDAHTKEKGTDVLY